ncbi:methionine gamma-lyase [Paratrimastix pyriformis]|uniref:Methionine gamma-lyase n=1 Tax=Paratrimastix pyriformis TaxID=342808 RepID=A0ABQ8UQM8_9EUKA|nr:methionine gamma-lyase [Paratrimastix pyriformis]
MMGQVQISGSHPGSPCCGSSKPEAPCRMGPMATPTHGHPSPVAAPCQCQATEAALPDSFSFETRCLHADGHNKPMNSHVWPIFQTSTFMFDSPDQGADLFAGRAEGHIYSRIANPTVQAFERIMANIEEAAGSVAFGSGMGAVSAATTPFLKAGDTILIGDTLYGCTVSLFTHFYPRFGINSVAVDTSVAENVERAFAEHPEAKYVYLESPANPTCKISDIAAISEIAHRHGALVGVDCTFVTPYFQRCLSLGADLVLHSVTKYIAGHGDVVGGVVSAKTKEQVSAVMAWRKDIGAIMSPHDAFLVMRGLRTLPIRMEQLNKNGLAVARFLRSHPAIVKVNHPVFEDFPNHDIAVRQMSGFGSTFSFEMKSYEAAKALLENVHLAVVAVSLGGVDTLIEHPASMTHAAVPEDMLPAGLTRSLVRISVGLENSDELIADLHRALDLVDQRK